MQLVTTYHPPVDKFGERLRNVREGLDLNQVEIGRRVRKNKKAAAQFGKYLSRLETGLEDNPSLEILEDIARGMGLTLSQFFAQLEDTSGVSPTINPPRNHALDAEQNMNTGEHGSDNPLRSEPEENDRRRTLLYDLAHVLADVAKVYEPGKQAAKTRLHRSGRAAGRRRIG